LRVKNKNSISVPYASCVYGKEEIKAVTDVLSDPERIVAGPAVREFENKVSSVFGKKFGIMVNSGSSANLLAIEALNLEAGTEVITPALTFSTTVAPLIKKGLVPAFVDVEMGSYQADVSQIERMISKKTSALMIPSLIGNLPDLMKLRSLARKHGLWFIEDSADTLGATFNNKPTGYYSHVSTTSFYASHIITAAGSGGMLCVNNKTIANRGRILANWGRDSTLFGSHEESENVQKRFARKIDGNTYDAKFVFSELGFNFQSTELNAAFGLVQLARLKTFAKIRNRNFSKLLKYFANYSEIFVLPHQHPLSNTNWLAFPLVVKDGAGFTRSELALFLEKRNIQTRPIFTGNILRQPGFKNIDHRKFGNNFPVADKVMKDSLLIGCHHGLAKREMDYLCEMFSLFLNSG
jgi:CDP-6-deoxy-D-xylo-4-hexulose-3-dehydrase